MPTRLIREGINSSSKIDALSTGAELFYRRLMTVADDYGRFYSQPATLRGACWPTAPHKATEEQIEGWLEECACGDDPLIVVYEVKGCRYLEIQNFGQQTRSKSKYPEVLQTGRLSFAKQMLSTCESFAMPSRSRNSETKTEAETEAGGGVPADAGPPAQDPPSVREVLKTIAAITHSEPPKAKRGTRFALEEIPSEWMEWAILHCSMDTPVVFRTFMKFKNYWVSKARDATKVNWFATWQNWCLEEVDRQKRSPPSLFQQKQSPTDQAIELVHQRIARGERPFG